MNHKTILKPLQMTMPVRIDYFHKEGFLMRRVWYSHPDSKELIGGEPHLAHDGQPTEDEIMAALQRLQKQQAWENENEARERDPPQDDPEA